MLSLLRKKEYLIIFVIQVTEVFGFSLILPFLPFYAQELGASPFVVGLILASFSFFQFISAPIMGRISDYYGRKPMLVISQISTFFGFIILGFASTLWMIFLSRIVDGLFGSNMTIAQAYITDISSKKERSVAFGLSGIAVGFGFLVGPALGGFLSQYGYGVPSFLAAGVVVITILTTILFLPETVKRRKRGKIKFRILNISAFTKYFSLPGTSHKLWQFFIFILAHLIWVSTFAMYAERQLNMNAFHIGLLLTYVAVVMLFFRGVWLKRLIADFGENKLQFIGILSMIAGLTLAIFITRWSMFLVVMTFFAFGTGLLRPLFMGAISKSVSSKEQGTVLGVTNSLGSLAQIIAPLVGGFCIHNFMPGSLGLVAAVLMGFVLLDMLKGARLKKR